MKILAIDIGAGTEDVLLYDDEDYESLKTFISFLKKTIQNWLKNQSKK